MSTAIAIDQAAKPTHQRHLLAGILLLVVFFSYIDRVNVSILVVDPEFLDYFGITGQSVQKGLLMTLFLAAYGVGNVVLAPIGDFLGPRKAMSLSVVLWGLSLIVGGLAPTFMLLLFSRVILGLGEGLHFPMQSKYIKEWFRPDERGKANAVWQTGMAIAPAVAMPLFTVIIHLTGWRSSFFILATAGLIPLAAIWFFTADKPRDHKRINQLEIDHIEAGLAAERAKAPAVPADATDTLWSKFKSFASDYQFWLLVVYYVVHTSVIWGAMTWVPSYLKEARGFSWAAMGMLASLPWILGVVTKIVSGVLCDKMGRRAPVILFAMVGVGTGIYFGATAADNMTAAIFLAFGVGSIGLGGPAAWTLMQDIVPSRGISTAAGIMNGLGNGFSSLAPVAIGFLISVTGSYAGGLYYLVGCAFVGGVATLILTLKGR
ncbi:MFS transporter [Rhodoplanes roseus]|uniref:MFS transporter n=1 Tax=Rhodoplanes roseus TaxID=29409 RepID=A0A327KG42_9BRAD|nr:MFS transporter [Rhodoplanes roseus]RAI37719.1 MFS transporter [Rhodoplanes roseus]